ncbi:hypothetical protein AK812_SmicGene40959, partial [Symbiodinium microadriaticum]
MCIAWGMPFHRICNGYQRQREGKHGPKGGVAKHFRGPYFPEIFDDLGPYVLAKVTFAYDAGGTMKAWNIAGTEAKQVRVHFIQRKCDGEAFNLHDLDGASLGVRDLTLEALQSLLATTPPIATKSEPVQSTSAALRYCNLEDFLEHLGVDQTGG